MNPDSNQNIDYRTTLNVARVHNATARENPDRFAESRPVSLWVSLGAIALSAIGATYFGSNVGFGAAGSVNYNKFGASYQPQPPPYEGPGAEAGPVDPIAEGEKVYKSICVNCHQQNGLGVPGQYPPLDGSEWVIGSDERVAAIVGYGLSGPVTVKGQSFGAAVMVPHRPPVLTPKKLAYVISYIRNAWSNRAGTVAPEGIEEFLKRTGERGLFSAPEVDQIPANKMLNKPAEPVAAPAPAVGAPPAGAPAAPAAATPGAGGTAPPAAAGTAPPAPKKQ
jgi:mono/diheme cytochrome c family protein